MVYGHSKLLNTATGHSRIKLQVKFTHWDERHPQTKVRQVDSGRLYSSPFHSRALLYYHHFPQQMIPISRSLLSTLDKNNMSCFKVLSSKGRISFTAGHPETEAAIITTASLLRRKWRQRDSANKNGTESTRVVRRGQFPQYRTSSAWHSWNIVRLAKAAPIFTSTGALKNTGIRRLAMENHSFVPNKYLVKHIPGKYVMSRPNKYLSILMFFHF